MFPAQYDVSPEIVVVNELMFMQSPRGQGQGVEKLPADDAGVAGGARREMLPNKDVQRHRVRHTGADQIGAKQPSRLTFFAEGNGLRSIQPPAPQLRQIFKLPTRLRFPKKRPAKHAAPKLGWARDPIFFDEDDAGLAAFDFEMDPAHLRAAASRDDLSDG